MNQNPADLPEAVRGTRRLADGEHFRFGCHPGLACFNRCCADVNILLTPLDVLRLARLLGVSTREFLDTRTATPITKDLHLPVVMLKMSTAEGKPCPFVGPEGCTVYAGRPWACRMYPLGMGLPPARAGVEPQPVSFVFEDDFCLGRNEPGDWTAAGWRANQGVNERDDIEAGFRELVSHPWFIGGRQLDPRRMELFFTACYDLDTFRDRIFQSSFLQRFVLEEELVARLAHDDEALLRFAFRWLRFALFAEPTVEVRGDAPSSRRKP